MRSLLICVGSRGDAEPFVALASRLLEETSNSVDLFIQPELKSLAPTATKCTIHELPFTQFDFYKYTTPTPTTKGANHDNERVRFVGIVSEIIAALCLPCWQSVLNVAKDCDIMVTSALSRSLCFALSAKLNKPTVLIHLQALVPTKYFPHYSSGNESVDAIINLNNKEEELNDKNNNINSSVGDYAETYWMYERYQLEFLQNELDQLYNKLGLSSRMDFETTKRILSGNDSQIVIANAMNDGLIPEVTDVGRQVHQIGPLADHYIPFDFVPPEVLVQFLSNINPVRPICVGFGSMPYNQVALILDALEEVDCKAVLVGKALELPSNNEWAKHNVLQIESIPYAWLLPQCQMMVCHGGAGVVNTTLRAGIPIVISPFFGDQFFHAELCKAKGLGARAGKSLPSATKDDFVTAIKEAATSSCAALAREFGERSSAKSLGVDNLVELMNTIINANT